MQLPGHVVVRPPSERRGTAPPVSGPVVHHHAHPGSRKLAVEAEEVEAVRAESLNDDNGREPAPMSIRCRDLPPTLTSRPGGGQRFRSRASAAAW